MSSISRREFLRLGAALAAGFGLGQHAAKALAGGLQTIFSGRKRVLWLQGMSCTGCSVSLLNADEPSPLELLTQVISLVFHSTLSATQGAQAMQTIEKLRDEGKYYLVFEGAVPTAMPDACVIGERPMTNLLPELLRRAELVIGAGTCAAFGGIPAADGNVTGATSVMEFMKKSGIPAEGRLINVPGCPIHPHCLITTLAYAAGVGYPPVHPERLTPNMLFATSVHDDCPRFHYWEKEIFAEEFGDKGCLFKLGCLGPHSHTNCPQRQWNGGVNWCIRAGAPCTACTSENFARHRTFSFYRKNEPFLAAAAKNAGEERS